MHLYNQVEILEIFSYVDTKTEDIENTVIFVVTTDHSVAEKPKIKTLITKILKY